MKLLKFSLIVALMAFFAGCASTRLARPAPPTLDEIVAMSKAGTPAEEIIKKLKESRAYYPLTASEITKLSSQGVSDAVLDYIHEVHLREVREDEAQRSYHRGGWWVQPYFFFGHGYHSRWHGGLYYGW
jgi:hypothetical protein